MKKQQFALFIFVPCLSILLSSLTAKDGQASQPSRSSRALAPLQVPVRSGPISRTPTTTEPAEGSSFPVVEMVEASGTRSFPALPTAIGFGRAERRANDRENSLRTLGSVPVPALRPIPRVRGYPDLNTYSPTLGRTVRVPTPAPFITRIPRPFSGQSVTTELARPATYGSPVTSPDEDASPRRHMSLSHEREPFRALTQASVESVLTTGAETPSPSRASAAQEARNLDRHRPGSLAGRMKRCAQILGTAELTPEEVEAFDRLPPLRRTTRAESMRALEELQDCAAAAALTARITAEMLARQTAARQFAGLAQPGCSDLCREADTRETEQGSDPLNALTQPGCSDLRRAGESREIEQGDLSFDELFTVNPSGSHFTLPVGRGTQSAPPALDPPPSPVSLPMLPQARGGRTL